jgi:hypothetical protein
MIKCSKSALRLIEGAWLIYHNKITKDIPVSGKVQFEYLVVEGIRLMKIQNFVFQQLQKNLHSIN